MKNRYFVNINLIKIEVIKIDVESNINFGSRKFTVTFKKYELE